MADSVSPSRHTFLEPEWFWDGRSERAHRGVGVYMKDSTYEGPTLPTYGKSFSASHVKLPGRMVTPGLVNFHTHLELSLVPRPEYGGDFLHWMAKVMSHESKTPAMRAVAAARGAGECVRHGVTTVLDITRHPREVRDALAGLPLRVDSCGEVSGLAGRLHLGEKMLKAAMPAVPMEWELSHFDLADVSNEERRARLRAAVDHELRPNRIMPGLAPHAPYSTDSSWYKRLGHMARGRGCAFTTHLAVTPEERQFLRDHTGPFRELWDRLGDWKEGVECFPDGPVWWLEHHGVLEGTNLTAAHVNDVDDEELRLLGRRKVKVVHCPRAHAYFGRPAFELERYRAAGVTVKLGTDSSASAGDLNLMADLRLFGRQNPGLTPAELFGMVMVRPLEIGAQADFVVWRVYSGEPISELLASDEIRPEAVYIGGEEVRLMVVGG